MSKSIKKSLVIFAVLLTTIIIIGQVFEGETKEEEALKIVSEQVLVPGGQTIGVKMDVKGVLIVGLEEIETENGDKVNPGIKAGLEIGDTVVEINGTKVYKASEVQSLVNKIKSTIKLKIKRKNKTIDAELTPVVAKKDGLYKLGVWVKDKTAGIGTLTYYNPANKTFGALGHAIIDPDTDTVLSVNKGELLRAKVESVKEGSSGDPGEIRGVFFDTGDPLGKLKKNSLFGIFGKAYEPIENSLYPGAFVIGTRDQVEEGEAYILTTLQGNKVEKFTVDIEHAYRQNTPSDKSFVIRVTDQKLLTKSGGIVQGMSGSPVIQNNRIIGAVTHVFLNNPKKGYGIYIEWMLQEAASDGVTVE